MLAGLRPAKSIYCILLIGCAEGVHTQMFISEGWIVPMIGGLEWWIVLMILATYDHGRATESWRDTNSLEAL